MDSFGSINAVVLAQTLVALLNSNKNEHLCSVSLFTSHFPIILLIGALM